MSNRNLHARIVRHRRVRSRMTGSAECPRLVVFRSLKHIQVQLIDDAAKRTLVAASDAELKGSAKLKPVAVARQVGQLIATKAKAKGIGQVVFDRGGYAYHGRVAALAEGARQDGLTF